MRRVAGARPGAEGRCPAVAWATVDPEQLADRPFTSPLPSRLPADPWARGAALNAHAEALARGDSMYADPASGLFVLTAAYLADRGYCCGRGCRHCPYALTDDPQDIQAT